MYKPSLTAVESIFAVQLDPIDFLLYPHGARNLSENAGAEFRGDTCLH